MQIEDLVGEYQIIGTNQNDSKETYKGTLSLTLDKNNRIIAKWVINKSQEQFGVGFLINNLLTIHFYYKGEDDIIFNGKVIYKCLTRNILEGTWTEQLGNPEFLGIENCFKISHQNELLN